MNYTDFENLPLALSVEQLAAALSIGRTSAYNMVRCGAIKSVRVGHQIRVPKGALQEFLKKTN